MTKYFGVVLAAYNEAGRRCFLDDIAARLTDATRDKFGSGNWERRQCTGVTTEFPDAQVSLPSYYFEATGCAEVGVPAN